MRSRFIYLAVTGNCCNFVNHYKRREYARSDRPVKRPRFKIKIHHEGTNILVLLAIVLAMLMVAVWVFVPTVVLRMLFTAIAALAYGFVFNFFRCPARHYQGDPEGMVISSVDGRVVAIEQVDEQEYMGGEALMVSVFMSPLNVHANWFPVDGRVEYVRHHAGRFLSAYLPKASTENERSTIGLRIAGDGRRMTVRQVAGAMARRIVTYAQEGQECLIDEHLGFIKFGSRVDLYLPLDVEVLVKIGDHTKGGLTPVARLVSPVEP